MLITLMKLLMFFGALIFLEFEILPWMFLHDDVPFWAAVLCVAFLLIGFIATFEYFLKSVMNKIGKKD